MIYDYTIHQENSPQIFKETCELISEMFPGAKKANLLVDVDGSTIQTFSYNGKDIDVYDDYDVGAVFVKSEIPLDIFLKRRVVAARVVKRPDIVLKG